MSQSGACNPVTMALWQSFAITWEFASGVGVHFKTRHASGRHDSAACRGVPPDHGGSRP